MSLPRILIRYQVNVDGDIREMDDRMREIRDELEERIQTILENPLNDVE